LPRVHAGMNELKVQTDYITGMAPLSFIDDVTLTLKPTLAAFSNFSFELPDIADAGNGPPTTWTTGGRVYAAASVAAAGIAPITSPSPAPVGDQVALSASPQQSITLAPGFYVFRAWAAHRAPTSKTFRLTLDGATVSDVTIPGGSWQRLEFPVTITERGQYTFKLAPTVGLTWYVDYIDINFE
jgi:hypothetical protein